MRVKLPGGSLPMIVRVSTPRCWRASACNSACSTTAPQKDQEYGTTIPTFIALRIGRSARQPKSPSRFREGRREPRSQPRRGGERDHVERRSLLHEVLIDERGKPPALTVE